MAGMVKALSFPRCFRRFRSSTRLRQPDQLEQPFQGQGNHCTHRRVWRRGQSRMGKAPPSRERLDQKFRSLCRGLSRLDRLRAMAVRRKPLQARQRREAGRNRRASRTYVVKRLDARPHPRNAGQPGRLRAELGSLIQKPTFCFFFLVAKTLRGRKPHTKCWERVFF